MLHRPAFAAAAFLVCLLALGACAADEPARVDGRAEPTAGPGPLYNNDEQRLSLIRTAQQRRAALQAKYPPPELLCRRVSDGAIVIDGKLDEPAWKQAAVATDFRICRSGQPVKFQTRVRLAWDSKFLYLAFECDDNDVAAAIKEHDGELWREDAVEVFLNPTGDEMSYIEIEANPLGTLYDASIADYRPEVDWSNGKFDNHIDIAKTIRIFKLHGSRVAVRVNGTLNDPSDQDKGWICEMALSWEDIRRGTNAPALPPADGDRCRIGLYRINIPTPASSEKTQEYAAWNPTGTWFHCPWSFGHLIFVK